MQIEDLVGRVIGLPRFKRLPWGGEGKVDIIRRNLSFGENTAEVQRVHGEIQII
jgi:hypothetical protein